MRESAWLAVLMAITMPSWVLGQETSGSCDTPRYLFVMGQAAEEPRAPAATLISGLPSRLYEGEPLEWSHYQVTALPCNSLLKPAFEVRPGLIAGIFLGAPADDIEADLVPQQCDQPVYLLGVNTVTDESQYRIYAAALSASRIAQRHGFKRLFGRTPNPLLAGDWPASTTATLSVWPCAAAFEAMYYSDWYQKDILPLRKDSARYRLMIFRPAN